ncbi:MAG: response regulator transcription factor [Oscillospiraceae bacterium]|nr:response regulator transcription factor [Oscillospiraceae bacterium]
MIETVIVEDSPMAMRYLQSVLREDGGFSVLGEFEDAFRAEEFLQGRRADLVLMDVLTQHSHSGLAAGERIRQREGAPKVVIVTSLIDPEVLQRAKAGAADSLWYKDHGSRELLDVIRRTLGGQRVFPDSAPSVELRDMLSGDISPRQFSILRRFVRGMTYEEIAKELKITESGVRWNMKDIIDRAGYSSRHELLTAILQNKLIVTNLMDTEEE